MAKPNKKKQMQISRAQMELKLELLKVIHNFKSKEEPKIKLSKLQKASVVADVTYRIIET